MNQSISMEEIDEIFHIITKNAYIIRIDKIEELFNKYKEIVKPNADLSRLAKKYEIPMTKDNTLNASVVYKKRRLELVNYLYNSISNKLNEINEEEEKQRLKNEWNEAIKDMEPEETPNDDEYFKQIEEYYKIPQPKLTPEEAEARIVKYVDSDEYKQHQKELEEKQKQIELLQRRIEEQQKQIEELTKKNKAESSKLIIDGIKSKVLKYPAIHDLPAQDEFEKIYKQSHKNLDYDEYKEKLNENKDKIKQVIDEINNNEYSLHVNFEGYDNKCLKEIGKAILKWLGNQPITEHRKVQFKVGNYDWKTATLNIDSWKKFKECLGRGDLVYDLELTPEWSYKAGEKITELPHLSLISEIYIMPPIQKYKGVYKDNGGHFFEYLNNSPQFEDINEYFNRLQIFDKLSLDGKTQREELNDCCLIYALKILNVFTEPELNLMRMRIKSRYLSFKALKELCKDFKFKIIKQKIDEEAVKDVRTETINDDETITEERTVYLCQYRDHYFINELTPFTKDYIEHIDIAPKDAFNKRYRKDKAKKGKNPWEKINIDNPKEKSRFMSSGELVREWMRQNKFSPITFATADVLKTDLYDHVKDEEYPLEFDEESCLKLIQAPNENKNKPQSGTGKALDKDKVEKSFWYADFEADTSQEIHKPFMCVLQSADGKIEKVFKGKDCGKKLLECLPENAICYFHNLAYDWCMFMRYASRVQKVIKKGSKVYQAKLIYKKKLLTFKDSYPIFMCKLSVLPKAFGLKDVQKELFPYKYYTLNRLESNEGIINEAGINEDKKWTEEDYKTFEENIDSIPGCRLSENTFDMYKYAEFYCKQDVRILREAFEKLCDGFMNEFNIDVKSLITTPTLANEFFSREVYEPNKNLYYIGGHVRDFISRAVYGGRCMTAYNKKWHTINKIYDYDAVSLYPSAMRRLWTVEGKPEVLNVPDSSIIYKSMPSFLQKYNTKNGVGAFVVEINIVKVNKHYAFPLIVQHTEDGNLNDDNIIEGKPVKMVVDNIMLEDLIEFQKIEFQIIKGYVWNGKRDFKIQEVIQKVFDSRLKYKAEKNPLEQLYKLIMNSSYGKTIQKPIETDLKFVSKWKKSENEPSEYERYIQKNYNKIIEIIEVNDDIAIIKVKKQIDKHFNFSLLGVQVLSMSKRIMNEVMCLGFDIGCHIYYQDTDSMHIEADDLPKLEEAFEEKYKRPLRGKAMGQFHSDFPTINDHDEIPQSIESYFLMKKVYIDKLQDSTGDIDYMIRGKGLTQQSIKYAAGRNGGIMNLYKSLFEGNEETFNLCDGQPSFEMLNNFTISTREAFIRKIKTTYEEGLREKYFNYVNY